MNLAFLLFFFFYFNTNTYLFLTIKKKYSIQKGPLDIIESQCSGIPVFTPLVGRGVPSNSIRTLTFRWSRAVRRHRRKALPRQPWSQSPDGHYTKTTYTLQKTSVSTRHRSSRQDEHAEK